MMFASPLFLLFARAARLEQFSPLGKVSQRHKRPSNDESTLSTGRENVEGDCCLLDSNRGNFQPRILRLVLSGLLVASHTSACDPKRTYFSSSAAGSQSVDRASRICDPVAPLPFQSSPFSYSKAKQLG